jgi:PKD repeat protein
MRKSLATLAALFVGLSASGGSIEGRAPAALMTALDPVDRIAYDYCFPTWDGHFCAIQVVSGGPVTGLPWGLGWSSRPKWSPDGSRIVFAFDDAADIRVVDVATGVITTLTSGPAFDTSPAWSPDGSQIAFASYRAGSRDLYVMNADGTNPRQLSTASGFAGSFAWSPKAPVIAFVAEDSSGAPALHVVNADGPTAMPLAVATDFFAPVAWSPDGTRIVFDCTVDSGNSDICAIAPDGSQFARLTSDPAFESNGVISPADGRLAFVTTRFGDPEIAVMTAAGALTRVAAGTAGAKPQWSPEGARLLFTGFWPTAWVGTCYFGGGAHPADDICEPAYEIYVVNADGTGLATLAVGDDPHWFSPRPQAVFASQCSGSLCEFDGSGSFHAGATIVAYAWDFGDGTTASGPAVSHPYASPGPYAVTLTVTGSDGATASVTRSLTPSDAPPVAVFTVSCSGRTCNVDGSGSSDAEGPIASYAWGFGDGSVASGASAAHTYPLSGSYAITLTVRDNAGGTATTSQPVTIVNLAPVAAIAATCGILTCGVDGSASRDPDGLVVSYAWQFGDGSMAWTQMATYTYPQPGTYTLVLTVTDNEGRTNTATQSVTVAYPAMHVGDLDGTSQKQAGTWKAIVTLSVHDLSHGPVAGATVTGSWSNGVGATCTTSVAGTCSVTLTALSNRTASVTFSVGAATHDRFTYGAANHDPDGDSSGTAITVKKP